MGSTKVRANQMVEGPTFDHIHILNTLYSSRVGANSDGSNIWIGTGGSFSIGEAGATHKGSGNVAIGVNALYYSEKGYYNTALGLNALMNNTSGYQNFAGGTNALLSNTTGYGLVAVGAESLSANTTGFHNFGCGYFSLRNNTIGYGNVALGVNSAPSMVSGLYNTAIGCNAMYSNTTGSYEVAIGALCLFDLDNTSNNGTGANTAIGYNTGRGIITGVNNTIIGANVTGLSASLSNNIIISDGAGNQRINVDSSGHVCLGAATGSYLLTLASDSAGKPGAGGLWTVISDERIKKDVIPADLSRCYDIVKSLPLKRFGFADGVYLDDQILDKYNLGWIAQDVQKVFPKAVKPISFKKLTGEVIEDCLDFNAGQTFAAMYGALQYLIHKVELLEGV